MKNREKTQKSEKCEFLKSAKNGGTPDFRGGTQKWQKWGSKKGQKWGSQKMPFSLRKAITFGSRKCQKCTFWVIFMKEKGQF